MSVEPDGDIFGETKAPCGVYPLPIGIADRQGSGNGFFRSRFFVALQTPEPDGRISAARQGTIAIWQEGHTKDGTRVTRKRSQPLTGLDVPEPQHPIVLGGAQDAPHHDFPTSRKGLLTVPGKSHASDHCWVFQAVKLFAARHVPDAQGLVNAAGEHLAAIGSKGDAHHLVLVTVESAKEVSRRQVPQPDQVAIVSGERLVPSGEKATQ